MCTSVFQRQGQSSLTWIDFLKNRSRCALVQKEYKGRGGREKFFIWNLKTKKIFYKLCESIPQSHYKVK